MASRRIAVALASFNRRALTLQFLDTLERALSVAGLTADIVLVDDNTSDGTRDAIAACHPLVEVVRADGNLYWAGSVRKAMSVLEPRLEALDGILLANDDVELAEYAISDLYSLAHGQDAVVGGAVYARDGRLEATGGRLGRLCKPRQTRLEPAGQPQRCDLLPAHALYIPTSIYRKLGPFDPHFLHGHIDLEYGLRARRAGVRLLLAPRAIGTVREVHDYTRATAQLGFSPAELLWRLRYHPKSPPLREGVRYLRMISPVAWPLWIVPYYRGYAIALARSLVAAVTGRSPAPRDARASGASQ
jgi:GT2 family glycosyltransferase